MGSCLAISCSGYPLLGFLKADYFPTWFDAYLQR
uniref:Uncharacterized protein n=1 Tax=Anguilla anguilla TaxID=7936 RepID=A0A0E9R4Y4_ANGAN